MSELHLDLCRQSTKHLHDTMSSLKENLRILEVFVTSGLSEDGKSKQGSSVGLTSTECSQESGERSQDQEDKEEKRLLERFDRHQHCCCMCPARLGRIFCNSGYHRGGGGCCPSNSSVVSSRRSRPVSMPRLNRTASLRRDTAVERASRINSQKH